MFPKPSLNWLKWIIVPGIVIGLTIYLSRGNSSTKVIRKSICETDPDFAFIPAGEFIAGSDRNERDYAYQISAKAAAESPNLVEQEEKQLREKDWFEWEMPSQVKFLPSFCISRNLVTNADYQAFIQATGHRSPGISEAEYQQQGFLVHPYKEVQPYLWTNNNYPAGEAQHPVVLVSYEDAQAFAQWKGEQEGRTYRIPTAIEWEKSARGTQGSYFPWGNQWQDDATNWAKNGSWHTSAIATYPLSRSFYGIEDMAGNVFEYTSTLKPRGIQTVAVMKGCSWDDLPGFCRAAYQHTRPIKSRHILFGFRLVREPD